MSSVYDNQISKYPNEDNHRQPDHFFFKNNETLILFQIIFKTLQIKKKLHISDETEHFQFSPIQLFLSQHFFFLISICWRLFRAEPRFSRRNSLSTKIEMTEILDFHYRRKREISRVRKINYITNVRWNAYPMYLSVYISIEVWELSKINFAERNALSDYVSRSVLR